MSRNHPIIDSSSTLEPWTTSPYTHRALAREFGQEIQWRPILVGGIFNTINPSVYQSREKPVPAKAAYYKKDMADWELITGLRIKMRPDVFPVNSVKAMRGCIFLEPEGKLVPFARDRLRGLLGREPGYLADEVLAAVCDKAGDRPETLLLRIAQQAIKDKLRD